MCYTTASREFETIPEHQTQICKSPRIVTWSCTWYRVCTWRTWRTCERPRAPRGSEGRKRVTCRSPGR
eukprot:3198618-Prymnesium_polylepis.1